MWILTLMAFGVALGVVLGLAVGIVWIGYCLPFAIWLAVKQSDGRYKDVDSKQMISSFRNATRVYISWITRKPLPVLVNYRKASSTGERQYG